MGLTAGKDYSAKDIQAALRNVTGNTNLVVTIKTLGTSNATLVLGGIQDDDIQLAGSFGRKDSNIVWAKDIQGLVKDAMGGETLDWSGS